MKRNFRRLFVFAVLVMSLSLLAGGTVSEAKKAKKGKKVVKVVKAKKLKMKKKKITIRVGQKKKISVKTKPKKATIKWSSSKKKIATVSKKGVVTGKKVGTAKITAKSGKKKATCKVVVKRAAKKSVCSITSVQVYDGKTVHVTLSKGKTLRASDFSIRIKRDASGTYNKSLKVASVVANASKTAYDITMYTPSDEDADDYNYISKNDYVRVYIPKLNGTKVKDIYYVLPGTPALSYVTGMVNEEVDTGIYFDGYLTGYCTYKVSGLPKGFKSVARNNSVYISGKSSSVLNGKCVTITAKGEKGKTVTRKLYLYIASSSQPLTYLRADCNTVLSGDERNEYFSPYTIGGSGSYTYALKSGNANIALDEDNDIRISDQIAPGSYRMSWTVTDSNKKSATGTFTVAAQKAVKITGRVVAGDNRGADDIEVEFEFDDVYNRYHRSYYSDYTNEYGEYTAYVAPSKRYTMRAEYNGVSNVIRGRYIGTAGTTINFALPLYKVSLTAKGQQSLGSVSWYTLDSYGDWDRYLGSGSVLYLKKGTYQIRGTYGMMVYTATVTVNGNTSATVNSAIDQSKVDATLTTDGLVSLEMDSYTSYYLKYTPGETGTYTFSSSAVDEYLYGELYNDQYSELTSDSNGYDYDAVEKELQLSYSLQAGKTYYLRLYCEGTRDIDFSVSKTVAE